ncbi:MAG: HEPN domain-containing protein [Myxococcaceae bacterium]
MTSEGKRASAAEELVRAKEELEAAELLLNARQARIALTRAYYSAFHAARALLHTLGEEPKTHRGALSLFRQRFVKTGKYTAEVSHSLSALQRFREEADYESDFVTSVEAAAVQVLNARSFVEQVEKDLPGLLAPLIDG